MNLDHKHIERILASLIIAELGEIRKQSHPPDCAIHASVPIAVQRGGQSSQGFEADSLELLRLAARVNQFFHLHETGIEDNLLRKHTLGEWTDIVEQALAHGTSGISFQTSGSTGAAKLCFQSWRAIWREVQELAAVLLFAKRGSARRIIACVQPYHIYGFLFTAALPSFVQCEVVDGLHLSPATLLQTLRSGDVLVSFPNYWEYLAASIPQFPSGIQGVTSTAPCPPMLKKVLRTQRIERLVEVYGSSETSGVGWRENDDEYFRLFSYWQMKVSAEGRFMIGVQGTDEIYELMDRVEVQEGGQFKPTGRTDGVVQVGGVNVFPAHIAERLKTLNCVADCAVRPMRGDEGNRLKAFIVLQAGWKASSETEQYIRQWMQENLSVPECPSALTFGAVVPKNAMGKLADW
jgi:4-coumarate--CoA ligase (photoactive yellow protein activation family)